MLFETIHLAIKTPIKAALTRERILKILKKNRTFKTFKNFYQAQNFIKYSNMLRGSVSRVDKANSPKRFLTIETVYKLATLHPIKCA